MEILISFIIPFIILLTVVVFIHEYGHYYYAKKYGVGVTDFSIGFGKELFVFNDKYLVRKLHKYNETNYQSHISINIRKNLKINKKT